MGFFKPLTTKYRIFVAKYRCYTFTKAKIGRIALNWTIYWVNICWHLNVSLTKSSFSGNVQYMLYNVSTMLDQQEESLHSQIKRCEDIFSLVDAQSKYIQANAPLLKGILNWISSSTFIITVFIFVWFSKKVKTNAKTNQNKQKEEKPKSTQPNKSALTTKENLPKSTKKLPVPSTKKQISVTSCVEDSKKSKPLAKQNQNDPQMSNGSPFPQMLPLSKTEIEGIPR